MIDFNQELKDPNRQVLLHDMCLRDGMHAKREQISVDKWWKSPPAWTPLACR